MAKIIRTQVCVAGGGSGGFGAACRAAELGAKTVLFEAQKILGGTSTYCGVNCWEPVTGAAFGLPRRLYDRMKEIPGACGIYAISRHFCFPENERNRFPGGENKINPKLTYEDTLKLCFDHRFPWQPEQWNGVVFEPDAWNRCARKMLDEAGCEVIVGRRAVALENDGERIRSVTLDDGTVIEAEIWVDNCGFLACASGCGILFGSEPRALFKEPDAPEMPDCSVLNGVTLLFRITPAEKPGIEPLPPEIPSDARLPFRGVMVATQYPNGDFGCNMLPTMRGIEYLSLGEEAAYKECVRRVRIFWHDVQEEYPDLRSFRIKSVCPAPGIRETFRVRCDYMLSENDLTAGVHSQEHSDMVVMADHLMDRHGAAGQFKPVFPYGIPYRSLLPEGKTNLLVAGRIGGFSCIAATSCRLSRTVMRLGEAAGAAAALALSDKCDLRKVNINKLQQLTQFKEEIRV